MKLKQRLKEQKNKLLAVALLATYSSGALAFGEILSSTTAANIAKPLFGIAAVTSGFIAVVKIVNDTPEGVVKLVTVTIILGAIAAQYKDIAGTVMGWLN